MARLQVYDPFATTAGIDELFRGFFAPVRRGDGEAPQAIRLDVTESEQSYIVRAEVPGVKKEDIHVTIEGNQVTIAAEVKRESEKKEGDRVIHTERYAGQPKLVGADASHAWCATYLPGWGWLDLDPTNDQVAPGRHSTVAWGRDYRDVAPLRGVVVGPAAPQELTVAVDVSRL